MIGSMDDSVPSEFSLESFMFPQRQSRWLAGDQGESETSMQKEQPAIRPWVFASLRSGDVPLVELRLFSLVRFAFANVRARELL